jgi:hypothetical protein
VDAGEDKQLTNTNRNKETYVLERKSTQLSVTTFSYRSLSYFFGKSSVGSWIFFFVIFFNGQAELQQMNR